MSILDKLLGWVFVSKCPFCGRLLQKEDWDGMCSGCRRTLPYTSGRGAETHGNFFDECVSPLYYQEGVRRAITRYKFRSMRGTGGYHRCFSELMVPCIREHYHRKFDLVTWVPVSEKRKKDRGYDQAELLARDVGEMLGLPVLSTLEKSRNNAANSGIRQEERRRANVSGVYKTANGAIIKDKAVLVIDDVITTGATLSECARTLLMGGAGLVFGATVAKTGKSGAGRRNGGTT